MSASLSPEALEAARRNAENAPVSDRLIEDMRQIIYGSASAPPAEAA